MKRLTLIVAALLTLAGVCFDRVLARGLEDLGGLNFGWPIGWLVQDQSVLSPPFPHWLTVGSPGDFPTHIRFVPLLADFLIAYLIVVVIVAIGRFVRRRIRLSERRV